jgi:2-keto-4-pentenoate hydratase/2-oxohepta-3-ene-1,7-dioic acid hydratase in catechol pathway
MKIVRFEHDGRALAGLMQDGGVTSFAALGMAFDSVERLIAGGDAMLAVLGERARARGPEHALSAVKLLAPLANPRKFLAIGLNYRKHIEEFDAPGRGVPPHQIWFNKQVSCINGPGGEIDPGVTAMLDYEVELGAVIGKPAKSVSAANALAHVFGYTIVNDVTARDWQRHAATWTVGKSFDTHGPIGPCIVTADEIADPQDLNLRCFVNGQQRQGSNTRDMIHSVAQQIEYLSTAFTLEPGDILATGTPEGVGMAMTPPNYLKSGDVVRCEIDGIGVLENRVK